MNAHDIQSKSLETILNTAVQARRFELGTHLFNQFRGRVQYGPFRGMQLPNETSWGDGDICAKLLGTYESELHDVISEIVHGGCSNAINIGCAEGYYAVGLASIMPQSIIHAFDSDPNAMKICQNAARINDIEDRVVFNGACTVETLRQILQDKGKTFLLIDCEGAEKELLSLDTIRELAHTPFLVECHDFIDRTITNTLLNRFKKTHKIEIISEGARDPNKFEPLKGFSTLDRWLMVCEFRPEAMHWLMAVPKI